MGGGSLLRTRFPAPVTSPSDDRNRSAGPESFRGCRSLRTDDAKRSSLQNRAGHWAITDDLKAPPDVGANRRQKVVFLDRLAEYSFSMKRFTAIIHRGEREASGFW